MTRIGYKELHPIEEVAGWNKYLFCTETKHAFDDFK